jgi:hypothetical protein
MSTILRECLGDAKRLERFDTLSGRSPAARTKSTSNTCDARPARMARIL